MHRPALVIEMPEMSDEAAAGAYCFLQELIDAVESQYFAQLRRYYKYDSENDDLKDIV